MHTQRERERHTHTDKDKDHAHIDRHRMMSYVSHIIYKSTGKAAIVEQYQVKCTVAEYVCVHTRKKL